MFFYVERVYSSFDFLSCRLISRVTIFFLGFDLNLGDLTPIYSVFTIYILTVYGHCLFNDGVSNLFLSLDYVHTKIPFFLSHDLLSYFDLKYSFILSTLRSFVIVLSNIAKIYLINFEGRV